MKLAFSHALPDRRLLAWLIIGGAITFAFSIGGAAGLGFDASAIENGPQENLEIALLVAAALTFAATAVLGRGAGAPVLMLISLIFGLMGLREFETPIDNDVLAYFAGHPVRIHWAILALALTAWVTFRDRRWNLREHLKASGPVWAPLIAGAVIVLLGSLAEHAAGAAGVDTHTHDIMEWLEETLEVCAYVIAFVTAAWMFRIRRTDAA